jgi:hypothetical protein
MRAIPANVSVSMRGRMGALGFELFTHERIAVATPQCACHRGSGRRRAPFAHVRSVLLSIAAARLGFPRSDGPPFRRHEPRKRRCPAVAVMQVVTLTAQDVRNLSARQVRASAAANPPSEFQRSFVAPGRSVTRRERAPMSAPKIDGWAGPDNQVMAEMRVGKSRRFAREDEPLPSTTDTLCGYL